ncbi:MAG TPA: L-threonylcarbamoyladenylate synthase [Flavitalea sp.]|nr:L-threonylcarbamoyladenylate synthase [Flavitalea sp.]
MLIQVHPVSPQPRLIQAIVQVLLRGGIIIYPTDTIYGMGCSIYQSKAIEKICRIKQIPSDKARLSFICSDLSDMSRFTKSISTPVYRILKKLLPGPYTFILPASREVPKILKTKKETIGLRIPDNPIANAITKELGHPILSTSLPGEMVEEYTDPNVIHEKFESQVDLVIDGGIGKMIPSTVISFMEDEPEVLREGAGKIVAW